MKTRILTLTLALLFVVQLAYADPSITNGDLYGVEVKTSDGTVQAGVVIKATTDTTASLAVLENVTAAMKGNAPVVSKFFKDERKAIQAVLPAKTNANALQLMELSPLPVSGYTAGLGDLTATFKFPTSFVAGKPLVVMVGQVVGKKTTWTALAGVANPDGSFSVKLPANLLLNAQTGNNAVITILQ